MELSKTDKSSYDKWNYWKQIKIVETMQIVKIDKNI